MTDKGFVNFCNGRARVLAEYGVENVSISASQYSIASHYIDIPARVNKQRTAWLEFVGLIETAHLIWYYEYTNNISD